MPDKNKITRVVSLPAEVYAKVQARAAKKERSAMWQMAAYIKEGIAREELQEEQEEAKKPPAKAKRYARA